MSGVARASSGDRVGELGVALDRGVDRRRADHDRVVFVPDPAELGDATDVDEVVEVREPQREHRDEALPAGEHLGAVAELGEQRDRLVDGLGRVVLERRRLHSALRVGFPGEDADLVGHPLRHRADAQTLLDLDVGDVAARG